MMVTVAVLAGGISEEREVSLRSGANVANALRARGYKVVECDPKNGPETLWPQLEHIDVAFPALHGRGGEDGSLQPQLEARHIVYVGSGIQASRLCFDKWRYAELLKTQDINCPQTELVNLGEFEASPLSQKPFVLKPNDGGSSIDTFIVREPTRFKFDEVRESFVRHPKMLLQELIEGIEITIGVLNEKPLPVIEIIPPANQEFDYTNKYNGASQELCPPQHVNQSVQAKTQTLALQIHRLTGCRDMSRTDMMIDRSGQLFVLETNTIPGLTEQSLLPKAAAAAGLAMPELVDRLVQAALKRR
jgi:D-alanine-D-alanine ligase